MAEKEVMSSRKQASSAVEVSKCCIVGEEQHAKEEKAQKHMLGISPVAEREIGRSKEKLHFSVRAQQSDQAHG